MAPLPSLPLAGRGPAPGGLDTLSHAPSVFGSWEAPGPRPQAQGFRCTAGSKEHLVPSFVRGGVPGRPTLLCSRQAAPPEPGRAPAALATSIPAAFAASIPAALAACNPAASAPLAVRAHNLTKNEKSLNQSLAQWKLFICNLTTGEFLGRTANSWGLILLFYLVFYGFLAALFSFTMWVMLQTLNQIRVPKYRDQIPSPGLTVFPKPVTALEYTFCRSDPTSYAGYIEDLKKFLKPYTLEEQKNLTVCPDGALSEQKGPVYVACQFPISLLQACSGMNDPDFGYSQGNPCILVKMNRIIGLKPEGVPRIN
nr:LOW QUALITY PROTEIN: sodium/potassium-transporting ATPase subunit beta-3-like [Chlorocebus sabaeus]